MGNYIEIQDQLIRLRKKESLGVTTPAKAINEAIEFCKVNNLTECELDYDGFLFDIEPTSDLKEKLSDFNRARAECTNENSGLHLQSVNGSAKSELIKLIDDAFYYARETRPGYCGNLYENSQELVSDMEIDIDEFISKHCR